MKRGLSFLLIVALILGSMTLAPVRSSEASGALGEGGDLSEMFPSQVLFDAVKI